MSAERLVLVTRQTELEALVERFQTRSQAEFYLERAGLEFGRIQAAHDAYARALAHLRQVLPAELPTQVLERRNLPAQHFLPGDVVVALGPDGLVANIAKYLAGQPLVAVNPDPDTIDGVLLPVSLQAFARTLAATLEGRAPCHRVTMTEAVLADGQRLRAVNDLFVGARSHVSVRYRLETGGRGEEHSSSGLIVSTGVGSTGWLRSVYAGAIGIARALQPDVEWTPPEPLPWDTRELVFHVREPWPSMTTGAALVRGAVSEESPLTVLSRIPAGGVIFADGMESDYLAFNSGARVRIGIARESLQLVRPPKAPGRRANQTERRGGRI